jgi:hypothetical protein
VISLTDPLGTSSSFRKALAQVSETSVWPFTVFNASPTTTCQAFKKESKVTVVKYAVHHSSMTPPKAIFTTGPLGQNEKSSQQFASYGVTGSPCPISEARVTMFSTSPTNFIRCYLTYLWALIAAMITEATYVVTDVAFELPASQITFDITSRPPLVITTPGKIPENKRLALINAGFAEQTNGRYKYWKGPSTDAALKAALNQGVGMNALAPMNSISGNGLIAFSLINRLLHHTFRILANVTKIEKTFVTKIPSKIQRSS